jgi:2,3-bisphosphoglycerate-independent phosphoglycerate mutase
MSAYEVTDEVLKRLEHSSYDFILLNFANPDMVGHTGKMDAAIKACETVDNCLKKIVEKIRSLDGTAIITADHGNCEQMSDNNNPHTAHTMNPVPFVLINRDVKLSKKGGLSDVAPTVLDVIGIDKPDEMTGTSLII